MPFRNTLRVSLMTLAATASVAAIERASATEPPEPITFPSADGKTPLKGYLFKPATAAGPVPAVVMMHGRAGAYSILANGLFDASTLSQRHRMWGRLWAEQGYLALLVDAFGPRGYPRGFPQGSYESRPGELSEVTIRPLDAYGALAYLRSRPDVAADRVGLLGWSNGGSAAIATMSIGAPGIKAPTPASGFRAALAFYPACGLKGAFDSGYRPYAPVRIFMGTADDEVSPQGCRALVEKSRALSADVELRFYDGATHGFDDPGRSRQAVKANATANADAQTRALDFFAGQLRREP